MTAEPANLSSSIIDRAASFISKRLFTGTLPCSPGIGIAVLATAQPPDGKGLPKFKLERGVPDILDVETAARIMKVLARYKQGAYVPYFALALFAGIRPQFPSGELGKLAMMGSDVWKLVDLKNNVIRIPPEVAKTAGYRTIDIQPNLKAWLKPFSKKKTPIHCPNFERGYKVIRKHFGIGHDVLRHSFISYHCAQFQSVGGAALQAGNSEAIVRRHYLKMVAKDDAVKFWAIKP